MALPDIYQEVEWIGASGSQYINTGYVVNTNTSRIYTRFEPQNVSTSQGSSTFQNPLFGTRTSDYNYETCLWASPSNQTYSVGLSMNGCTQAQATPADSFPKYPLGTVIELDYGKTGGTYNSFSFTWNAQYQGVTPNLLIFGIWSQGSVDARKFFGKLYSFKIREGNNLVRDFVPCYRKSNGVIGLYDLVGNTFYTNAGSGTFTKSDDIKEFGKITHIYLGTNLIRPKKQSGDFYYSDDNWNEYQSLVSSVGSVQLVDTGKRYRFNCACYIGNRVAVNVDGTNLTKVNLDTLTVVSTKSSSISGKIWYFGDNRILTRSGIMDFDGNMITTFSTSYRMITPGLPGVVWANDDSYNMYKGIVNGDNVTFTKVGTSTSNSGIGASPGDMLYGRLGAYSSGNTENSTQYIGFYNVSTGTFSTITASMGSQHATAWGVCMPDGKIYKHAERNLGWGRLYRVGTSAEGVVGNSLSTGWNGYGNRCGKFLGNIISGGMNSNNGTGTGYGTNNYFINSSGTITLVQSNALAYDSTIYSTNGFVDENGWLYPGTGGGGSGVILKTDKTFTDFHWWNPYLYR